MTEMDKLHDQLIDETGIVVDTVFKNVGIEFEYGPTGGSRLVSCALTPSQARMMARLLVHAADQLDPPLN